MHPCIVPPVCCNSAGQRNQRLRADKPSYACESPLSHGKSRMRDTTGYHSYSVADTIRMCDPEHPRAIRSMRAQSNRSQSGGDVELRADPNSIRTFPTPRLWYKRTWSPAEMALLIQFFLDPDLELDLEWSALLPQPSVLGIYSFSHLRFWTSTDRGRMLSCFR